MKKLLVIFLTLIASTLHANPELLYPLDLLGIKYEINDEKCEEEKAYGLYYFLSDKILLIDQEKRNFSDKDFFRVVLHEMVHWANARPFRALMWSTDTYIKECVAELSAYVLQYSLYKGRYSSNFLSIVLYLNTHPASRTLTIKEQRFVAEHVEKTVTFLLKALKEKDTTGILKIKDKEGVTK